MFHSRFSVPRHYFSLSVGAPVWMHMTHLALLLIIVQSEHRNVIMLGVITFLTTDDDSILA